MGTITYAGIESNNMADDLARQAANAYINVVKTSSFKFKI